VPEGLGLRERKRRDAMRHVQQVALDLFDEHGFDAVTIEQVAAAAAVSPSSVYRYFGTKEGLVLYDPNEGLIGALHSPDGVGLPLLDALQSALAGFLADRPDGDEAADRRRVRYLMEVPAVQAAVARRIFSDTPAIARYVAERTGREVTDFEVRVAWGALYGGLLGALRHWHATGYAEPLADLLDRTLATLRSGLTLD
jgi:AcrR family transcriptional regulator